MWYSRQCVPEGRMSVMTVGLTVALIGAPLLLGLIGLLMPQRNRPDAAALGVAGAGVALALVTALLILHKDNKPASMQWVAFGDLKVTLSLLADQRALFVAFAVA